MRNGGENDGLLNCVASAAGLAAGLAGPAAVAASRAVLPPPASKFTSSCTASLMVFALALSKLGRRHGIR